MPWQCLIGCESVLRHFRGSQDSLLSPRRCMLDSPEYDVAAVLPWAMRKQLSAKQVGHTRFFFRSGSHRAVSTRALRGTSSDGKGRQGYRVLR